VDFVPIDVDFVPIDVDFVPIPGCALVPSDTAITILLFKPPEVRFSLARVSPG
jgi:hypothetical protein